MVYAEDWAALQVMFRDAEAARKLEAGYVMLKLAFATVPDITGRKQPQRLCSLIYALQRGFIYWDGHPHC